MIFVDGHVHMYDCFDVDLFFDSALINLQAAAGKYSESQSSPYYVLLLTEGKSEKRLGRIFALLEQEVPADMKISDRWHGSYSAETGSVTVFSMDFPGDRIHLVPGRQVVTREKIEVLALFCGADMQDGQPLSETVETVRNQGGIPVLPWGVGKWLGKRGQMVREFIQARKDEILFVGDNSGRPRFWPTPDIFHVARDNGVQVLPGTDPLPLAAEASRVGSFGFYVQEDVPPGDSPVPYLKSALLSRNTVVKPYGRLLNNVDFLFNQLRLRCRSCG